MKSLLVSNKTSVRNTTLLQRIITVCTSQVLGRAETDHRFRYLVQPLGHTLALSLLLWNSIRWWNANYILPQNPTEEVPKSAVGSDNRDAIKHDEGACAFQILPLLRHSGPLWCMKTLASATSLSLRLPLTPNPRSWCWDSRRQTEQRILKHGLPGFPSPAKIFKNPFWN